VLTRLSTGYEHQTSTTQNTAATSTHCDAVASDLR
jgi:hypothetical protein